MVILELVKTILNFILYLPTKFILWLITARDCKHCVYGEPYYYEYDDYTYICKRSLEDKKMCDRSITSKYFERKKKE